MVKYALLMSIYVIYISSKLANEGHNHQLYGHSSFSSPNLIYKTLKQTQLKKKKRKLKNPNKWEGYLFSFSYLI